MMHTHHIIPRHMGGTDAPDNLVSCTIAEHAEYHRVLFDEHGHEWDRIAWLSLSGQINVDEARRLAQLEGAKIGGTNSAAKHKRIRKLGSVAGGKAAMKKMNGVKWRCVECGMVSHAGGIGNHQRGSGHQGKEAVCQ